MSGMCSKVKHHSARSHVHASAGSANITAVMLLARLTYAGIPAAFWLGYGHFREEDFELQGQYSCQFVS